MWPAFWASLDQPHSIELSLGNINIEDFLTIRNENR
jgi:hypothetical protein